MVELAQSIKVMQVAIQQLQHQVVEVDQQQQVQQVSLEHQTVAVAMVWQLALADRLLLTLEAAGVVALLAQVVLQLVVLVDREEAAQAELVLRIQAKPREQPERRTRAAGVVVLEAMEFLETAQLVAQAVQVLLFCGIQIQGQ
jgi:hypothetical protein